MAMPPRGVRLESSVLSKCWPGSAPIICSQFRARGSPLDNGRVLFTLVVLLCGHQIQTRWVTLVLGQSSFGGALHKALGKLDGSTSARFHGLRFNGDAWNRSEALGGVRS